MTSNRKPSIQKPPNRKPPNQKPPNQKPPKVCHGWVDIKVGGEWAGRYSASFCHCFSLCQKESADMSADVVPTRHVMSSGMVRTTESDDVSGQHSRHFQDMSACRWTTCRLGGVPRHDTTPTFPAKLIGLLVEQTRGLTHDHCV